VPGFLCGQLSEDDGRCQRALGGDGQADLGQRGTGLVTPGGNVGGLA